MIPIDGPLMKKFFPRKKYSPPAGSSNRRGGVTHASSSERRNGVPTSGGYSFPPETTTTSQSAHVEDLFVSEEAGKQARLEVLHRLKKREMGELDGIATARDVAGMFIRRCFPENEYTVETKGFERDDLTTLPAGPVIEVTLKKEPATVPSAFWSKDAIWKSESNHTFFAVYSTAEHAGGTRLSTITWLMVPVHQEFSTGRWECNGLLSSWVIPFVLILNPRVRDYEEELAFAGDGLPELIRKKTSYSIGPWFYEKDEEINNDSRKNSVEEAYRFIDQVRYDIENLGIHLGLLKPEELPRDVPEPRFTRLVNKMAVLSVLVRVHAEVSSVSLRNKKEGILHRKTSDSDSQVFKVVSNSDHDVIVVVGLCHFDKEFRLVPALPGVFLVRFSSKDSRVRSRRR
ncbi:hypothetical protein T439DRAFT_380301 [Meredithblackwellia eburnea MCA 4105]